MFRTTALTLLAFAGTATIAPGAELKLFGSISGQVRNNSGVTQMGAVVHLLNRYERVVQKVLTSPDGRFRFDSLSPDLYSVRVSLSSFVPAMRGNIPVKAGMDSFLNIQLANLFSSIELVYTAPGQTGVLSEDWKWVLRGSTATRPVLRILDQPSWRNGGVSTSSGTSPFSSTSGVLRVSAGDGGTSSMLGSEPDLGTAFALATSLFGSNELRFAGNVGYASNAGTPTAGFRTRFSRDTGNAESPAVELTVRQAAVRQRVGNGLLMGSGEMPLLRTMSLKVGDRVHITDDLSLQYGAMVEAVVFLERMNLVSPFARLTYDLGDIGLVEVAYSSGAPAMDLVAGTGEGAVQDGLTGLAMFPRVSLSDGHARVQRNETYEVGFRKVVGSMTYSASVYQDKVKDGTVTVAGAASLIDDANLLPDLGSNSSIYNLGGFRTFGYSGSVSQHVWEGWTATLAAGAAGMLTADGLLTEAGGSDELRSMMKPVRRTWASARVTGQVPGSGTKVVTSYVWTPAGTLGPTHAYLTQRWQPQMGLNLQVRQPIPGVGGMPGRLEMTAEMRNMLAQGYVPVAATDGRTLWLVQFPRAIRGGLNFIF